MKQAVWFFGVVTLLLIGAIVGVLASKAVNAPAEIAPVVPQQQVQTAESAAPAPLPTPAPASPPPPPPPPPDVLAKAFGVVDQCVSAIAPICGQSFEWVEGRSVLERVFNCEDLQCEVVGGQVGLCGLLQHADSVAAAEWASSTCQIVDVSAAPGSRSWLCAVGFSVRGVRELSGDGQTVVVVNSSGANPLVTPYSERLPVAARCGMPGNGACPGGWTNANQVQNYAVFTCEAGQPIGDFGRPSLRSYIDGEQEAALDVTLTIPAERGGRMGHLVRVRAILDALAQTCPQVESPSVMAMQSGIPAVYNCPEGSRAEAELLTDVSRLNQNQQVRIRYCSTLAHCQALRRTSNRTTTQGL